MDHFHCIVCPLQSTMPKSGGAAAATAKALAATTRSVAKMNQCDGQCQGQQCQQIKR